MEPRPQHRKKGQTKPQFQNLNAFKAQQKHYKLYQQHQTDFTKLFVPTQQQFCEVDGFQVCQLSFPQGAYYVKNFIPYHKVVEIAYFALNRYCRRPYRTNLDSREQLYAEKNEEQVQQKIENIPLKQINENQTQVFVYKNEYYFNDKIRWANVGYQYDWTLRKYPQMKIQIHKSIQQLSDKANILYNIIEHKKREYRPQSAIINYYSPKDYMTGHLDDAQIDQESPIYSFSFGLSCIFLMGGRTKDEAPTALRLNSGDLLIMAGESRKCYHGVPRILQSSIKDPSEQEEHFTMAKILGIEQSQRNKQLEPILNNYAHVKSYIRSHRININIRQVYPQS